MGPTCHIQRGFFRSDVDLWLPVRSPAPVRVARAAVRPHEGHLVPTSERRDGRPNRSDLPSVQPDDLPSIAPQEAHDAPMPSKRLSPGAMGAMDVAASSPSSSPRSQKRPSPPPSSAWTMAARSPTLGPAGPTRAPTMTSSSAPPWAPRRRVTVPASAKLHHPRHRLRLDVYFLLAQGIETDSTTASA
ncbi:proline-rich receptor-like protein kinase PERK10 [Brachypodium distachyon]|uniref:proline-rich receptor-like protein kinase PERK10 n=1 Tax=Brachypodium distachyon TaxID=15368 RepID=UPI00071CC077|nr:proline-rich receptor-like protein kinase PERK10 [Brachypodium distachyon]|eukprot:XP_014754051.1 proline-rich receptor-like protein kinase PERK10 [Brachypodium distachyon]